MKRVTDTLGVSRSAQYERQGRDPGGCRGSYQKAGDAAYGAVIRRLVEERATYGYRRIAAVLNRQLRADGRVPVNHKRVYRIYKELELNLRIKPRKRLSREKPEPLAVPVERMMF